MTESTQPIVKPVADAAKNAAGVAADSLADTADAAVTGGNVMANAVANPGKTAKDVKEKTKGFFEEFDVGGVIGAVLGLLGALFAGKMFGGGIMGTILTICLAIPLIIAGKSEGGDIINGFLGRPKRNKMAAAPASERGPAAGRTPAAETGSPDAGQSAQAGQSSDVPEDFIPRAPGAAAPEVPEDFIPRAPGTAPAAPSAAPKAPKTPETPVAPQPPTRPSRKHYADAAPAATTSNASFTQDELNAMLEAAKVKGINAENLLLVDNGKNQLVPIITDVPSDAAKKALIPIQQVRDAMATCKANGGEAAVGFDAIGGSMSNVRPTCVPNITVATANSPSRAS